MSTTHCISQLIHSNLVLKVASRWAGNECRIFFKYVPFAGDEDSRLGRGVQTCVLDFPGLGGASG